MKNYDDDGILATSTEYRRGKKHGLECEYHNDGNLWRVDFYWGGQKNGICSSYDDNGELEKQGIWYSGKVISVRGFNRKYPSISVEKEEGWCDYMIYQRENHTILYIDHSCIIDGYWHRTPRDIYMHSRASIFYTIIKEENGTYKLTVHGINIVFQTVTVNCDLRTLIRLIKEAKGSTSVDIHPLSYIAGKSFYFEKVGEKYCVTLQKNSLCNDKYSIVAYYPITGRIASLTCYDKDENPIRGSWFEDTTEHLITHQHGFCLDSVHRYWIYGKMTQIHEIVNGNWQCIRTVATKKADRQHKYQFNGHINWIPENPLVY